MSNAQELFSAFNISVLVLFEAPDDETEKELVEPADGASAYPLQDDSFDGFGDDDEQVDDELGEDVGELLIETTVITTKQAYTLQTFVEAFESQFLPHLISSAGGVQPPAGHTVAHYELQSVSSVDTSSFAVF